VTDKAGWNLRLWWINANRVIADYSANLLPVAEYLAAGTYANQREQIRYQGVAYPISYLPSNTISIPYTTSDGTRVFPYIVANLVVQLANACERVTQIPTDAWLINNVTVKPEVNFRSGKQGKLARMLGKDFSQRSEASKTLETVTSPPSTKVTEQVASVIPGPTSSEQSILAGDTPA
jgi:hypothetical protein